MVSFRNPRTPDELLWRELEGWFREEDGSSHAGPDLTFDGLEAADVERVWHFLRSSAGPIDAGKTTWDEVDNAEVSVAAVLGRGAVAAAARCPSLLVGLDGINSHGVTLPWLGVFIYTDAIALYWWVSDDSGWNRHTVAALARLIDDLRRLAAHAQVALEWDAQGEFFPSIDRFLSADVRAED
jgi:hypothetical protein